MTLPEIKDRLTDSRCVGSLWLEGRRQGPYVLPLPEDKTPSMQVYFETNTVFCFSGNCKLNGKSLDVIDVCMYAEKTDKAGGFRKATELAGNAVRA